MSALYSLDPARQSVWLIADSPLHGHASLLGDQSIQSPSIDTAPDYLPQAIGFPKSALERLKRLTFPFAGREERIRKALEALRNMPPVTLDTEMVRRIAEDPDIDE
jgi:hypothetical protein